MTDSWYVLAGYDDDSKLQCLYRGPRQAACGFALAIVYYTEGVDRTYLGCDDPNNSDQIVAWGPCEADNELIELLMKDPGRTVSDIACDKREIVL